MRTRIQFEEIHDRDDPEIRRGLRLFVSGRATPTLAVDVCPPRCIRLATGHTARLWTRIEDDWYGYYRLRAESPDPIRILPPIRFQLIRKVQRGDRDKGVILQSWARRFATWLADAAVSPLSDGEWMLAGNGQDIADGFMAASQAQAIISQPPQDRVDWDFGVQVLPLTLRDASDQDSGRVRAWRKLSREGQLPPVLLCWISGFQTYVVLDGHDRLLAAALEGRGLPVLALTPIRIHPPDPQHAQSVMDAVERGWARAAELASRPQDRPLRLFTAERANQLLLDAFTPSISWSASRAGFLRGGTAQWFAEVRAELTTRGLVDEGLLDGLGAPT